MGAPYYYYYYYYNLFVEGVDLSLILLICYWPYALRLYQTTHSFPLQLPVRHPYATEISFPFVTLYNYNAAAEFGGGGGLTFHMSVKLQKAHTTGAHSADPGFLA